MSAGRERNLPDEYFFTPDSITSPGGKGDVFDLTKALNGGVSGVIPISALSTMNTLEKVERVLSLRKGNLRFESARREWMDLMAIVDATAELILGMDDATDSEPLTESFELELHRLTALSKAASVITNLQSESAIQSIEPGTIRPTSSSSDVVEAVINPIENSRDSYIDECAALLDKADSLKDLLSEEIDYRLRKVNPDSMENVRTESIEFAVSAEPHELDAFKKTNTMRWLNDVLKWQVIDMNIQMRKQSQIDEYRHLLELKKSKIKDILCRKIDKAAELKQLEIANRMLDRALEGLSDNDLPTVAMTRVSAASGFSLGSTAASSPPALTPLVQTLQSGCIKDYHQIEDVHARLEALNSDQLRN